MSCLKVRHTTNIKLLKIEPEEIGIPVPVQEPDYRKDILVPVTRTRIVFRHILLQVLVLKTPFRQYQWYYHM
jgi:hypothetical protein